VSLTLVLRERTRDAHACAEQAMDLPGRGRDRDRYAQVLRSLRSVYAPLERELDAAEAARAVLPDWPARRKTRWLDDDLLALGVPVPPDAQVAPLQGAEQVVGVAYVLEGATLGGALVGPLLAPGLPHRFFDAYGPGRGRMWRDFRRHVDGIGGLDEDAVVASAQWTFGAFTASCGAVPA
jgi:heme oxygenase